MSPNVLPPVSFSNFPTRPGPVLYAANASAQSPNRPCSFFKYLAAAPAHNSASSRWSTGSTLSPFSTALGFMNWYNPAAPAGLLASGFHELSTSACHTNSSGSPASLKIRLHCGANPALFAGAAPGNFLMNASTALSVSSAPFTA